MRDVNSEKENVKRTLLSMVRYANSSVPFYMDLYRECQQIIAEKRFYELPVIDKEKYISGGTSGLSVKYMREYINNELIWTRTSGTSGMFSEVYWHQKEMQRSLLSLWLLRKKYYGISAKNRLCYFYQASQGAALFVERRNSIAIARNGICADKMQVCKIYERILDYNPEWMILQPSIALILCDCVKQWGKPRSLRFIEFTGEYLEPSVKKKIEDMFQCRTANQYGTKEVNSIAYECPCGRLHIMSDNVYVETIADREDKNLSYICVTSLQNYAMPIIRFQLEDRGIIHANEICKCGVSGDFLELHSGRANDMVVMKEGILKHPYMLMDIFQDVNYRAEGAILQYQIQQKTVQEFVIRLVMQEKELIDEIEEEIFRFFTEKLGYEVNLEFEYFDTVLPVLDSGKPAVFYSSI